MPDAPDGERRGQVRHDVDRDERRRRDDLEQQTADRRRGHGRDGLRGLQLGVALDDVLEPDQTRHVALVRDVEEHGRDADRRRPGDDEHRRPRRAR